MRLQKRIAVSATPSQPLLMESIRLENGALPLLALHQERVNRSRLGVLGVNRPLSLKKALETAELPDQGLYKVRILYGEELHSVECLPYERNPVTQLLALDAGHVRYPHKMADRRALELCYQQRAGCDDVLLTHNGFITDTSYANVALFDGRCWWTPSHPMLRGVRRAKLLQTGRIRAAIIRLTDLRHFRCLRLINAMIDLDECPDIPLSGGLIY
jgi:4-amino-4-deoxychorismate lyase